MSSIKLGVVLGWANSITGVCNLQIGNILVRYTVVMEGENLISLTFIGSYCDTRL